MFFLPPAEEISRLPMGYGGRFYGVYPAQVTANADENHPGRIEISLPWCPDKDGQAVKAWARLAVPMAGKERGHWFVPDLEDEVLVSFEAGDPSRPFIIGALWNGVDKAPEEMKADNNRKSITTRKGIKLIMDDTEDAVQLVLKTPGGHSLTLQDGDKDGAPFVKLADSSGHTVTVDKDGITVKHSGGHLATVTGDEVALRAGQSEIVVKDAEISLKVPGGAQLTLDGSGIAAKNGAAALTVAPAEVSLGLPPASVKLAASGVMLAFPPGSANLGASGVLLSAGAGTLSVGADGLKLIGPTTTVLSPNVQVTAAMLQQAGIVQCATLIAQAVISPAIMPGPTNKL